MNGTVNGSQFMNVIPELKSQVTDVWLFFVVIIASGVWLVYLTFYNSRFLGWILSKVCSKLYNKDGYHLSFDSFSINILGGKEGFCFLIFFFIFLNKI